jgi:hypothetical protein
MVIIAIVPMVAIVSLSASMYKWEQLHLEAESLAEDYIFTCRKVAHTNIHNNGLNGTPNDQINKMAKILSSCDRDMLYYKGRCEIESSKFFCSNSALDGYLILRGIENAERPVGSTRT